ncbi:MAG: phytoene desaturase family protein [Promethearchaeota archaeon]
MNKIKGTNQQLDDDQHDVIIIGAGMGGLIAGLTLVKKGYSVLIIEKHFIPGGYCTNFTRKDFVFDSSLHMLNGCEGNGMINNVLAKIGLENKFEFIKLKDLFHWKCAPRNIDVQIPADLKGFQEKVIELFPEEKENVKKFFKDYLAVVKFMLSWNSTSGFDRFKLWLRSFKTFLRFMKSLEKSVAEVIKPYIKDEACINLITALSSFFGASIEELSAASFLAANFSYLIQGTYYIKGGSGNFSKIIAEAFKENGGNLLLSHEVKEIIIDDEIATGVRVLLKDGSSREFNCNALVVNSDPTKMVTELCSTPVVKNAREKKVKQGSPLPEKYVKKIKNRIPGFSVVAAYVGLDFDLKDKGITDYEIWVNDSESIIGAKEFQLIADELDFSKSSQFSVTIYSNIDPSCCPKGKSIVASLMYASPKKFRQAIQQDGGKRGENYKKLKKEIEDFFMKKISSILEIPDLEKHVEVVEIATPITLERYTQNRDGSTIGWKMLPQQMMLNQLSQKTPIKNMFLGSSWALYGGGVSAVIHGGYSAAKLVDKYLKNSKR